MCTVSSSSSSIFMALVCTVYNKFLQDVYFTNAPYLTIYVVLISQSPEKFVNGSHCVQVVTT